VTAALVSAQPAIQSGNALATNEKAGSWPAYFSR